MRDVVRKHCPENKDAAVMGVACGHGALIYFAREAGYQNIHSIDGSRQQVAVAHRLGIDCVGERGLTKALETQADSSLDVVVAFDVLEHFRRDELLNIVDHVHRVLRPGGR